MKPINPGIYLVLDPAIEKPLLLKKLKQALEGGISMLQIWNNWPHEFGLPEKQDLIQAILDAVQGYDVPVLINEEWNLLRHTKLDGVHFDSIPADFDRIRDELNRTFISGITCENDLERVRWAEENDLDYISFCSMFPSPSVQSCEIVKPETVRNVRRITQKPIFLSGGITKENLTELRDLHFDGVAIISGIMNAENTKEAVGLYKNLLNEILADHTKI